MLVALFGASAWQSGWYRGDHSTLVPILHLRDAVWRRGFSVVGELSRSGAMWAWLATMTALPTQAGRRAAKE